MFKVNFGSITVFEAPTVEAALSFALEIHRVSNVEHVVHILAPDDCEYFSLKFVKTQSK